MNPPQKKKKESTSSYFQGTIPFPLPRPPETKDELAVRLAAGRGEASVLRLDLREGGGDELTLMKVLHLGIEFVFQVLDMEVCRKEGIQLGELGRVL